MARKTSKKMMKTRRVAQPTQRRFVVQLPPNAVSYVDTAAILSRINQRLYRQGRGYHISSIEVGVAGSGARIVTVETLPHNWFTAKAHQLAFNAWRKSTADERAMGIKAGRWNDFKVLYNLDHTTTANRITVPEGLGVLSQGEWVYTQAGKIDGSGDIGFMMFDNTTANFFGVLSEYDALRDTDQNTPPAGASFVPYDELLAELNDDQADNLQEEGDNPPYQANTGLQNLVEPVWQVYNGIDQDITGTPGLAGLGIDDKPKEFGIYAPCGLLKCTTIQAPTGGDPVPVFLTIEVKAGAYKGVAGDEMY